MTDENSQFFAILTAVGRAKQANADALGVAWTFAQMGVGDANDTDPIPNEQQTQLINERRRAPLNQLRVDPANANVIIAEQVIPESVGGWWIREVGLYDADGDLVAVANCAPSFKPLLSQGSGRTQVVRMNLIVSNTANVDLKIDPSVVLATRQYVDSKILEELSKLDSKQSVRVATTANIALAGLLTLDGVKLLAGDRVLVKNQASAKDNGIYIAAAGAWKRAPDADTSAEVTSALLLSVEQGVTQADTRWQLVTDGAIVLGTTALTFQNMTQGFAPLNSPAFLGTPTAPTLEGADNSTKVANAATVRAIMAMFGHGSVGAQVLPDFKAIVPGGSYLAYGALVPNLATPNAPPDSTGNVLGVLAVTPRADCTYFLAFENGIQSIHRRFWVGQYNLPADSLYWSRLITNDDMPYRGKTYFKTAGVYQWTVPAGVTKVFVEVRGGGGSGAFGGDGSSTIGPGGGGGGGISERLCTVVPGSIITITVGAGGDGVSTEGAGGLSGGTSSFGSFCSATGGRPGVMNAGTLGGMGSGGDFNASLGMGFPPVRSSGGTTNWGGPGGGGEGAFAALDTSTLTRPGMGGGGRVKTRSQAGADGCVFITY